MKRKDVLFLISLVVALLASSGIAFGQLSVQLVDIDETTGGDWPGTYGSCFFLIPSPGPCECTPPYYCDRQTGPGFYNVNQEQYAFENCFGGTLFDLDPSANQVDWRIFKKGGTAALAFDLAKGGIGGAKPNASQWNPCLGKQVATTWDSGEAQFDPLNLELKVRRKGSLTVAFYFLEEIKVCRDQEWTLYINDAPYQSGNLGKFSSGKYLVFQIDGLTDESTLIRLETSVTSTGPHPGNPPAVCSGLNSVLSGVFLDCPDPVPCSKCKGGVTQLTLKYLGDSEATITVKTKKGTLNPGNIPPDGSFTLVGLDKYNKLGTEVSIYIDGKLAQKIHTSCSQPIAPGMVFGLFQVIRVYSRSGGLVCAQEPTGNACRKGFKVAGLNLKYTGDSCDASLHSQDQKKVSCSGDPKFDKQVYILVTDDLDPEDGEVFFAGTVDLNKTFEASAFNAGMDKLKSNTAVHIFDKKGGKLLQSVLFHTSCSQPLAVGNRFGGVEVVGLQLVD